jgi:hypothetical protein
MTAGLGKRMRAAGALLGAMLLSAAATAQVDRYQVFAFQPGDAAVEADLRPSLLPLAMITRPEAGKQVIFVEADQAGVARVKEAAKGPTLVYRALGEHVQASAAAKAGAASLVTGASGEPGTYYLFAHLEAAPDKERAFNHFYGTVHQIEVLQLPGMQWSVRGELVSQAPEAFNAPRYVAIYAVKSHDLKATMAEFDRRMKEKVITPFPDGVVGRNILIQWAGPAPAAQPHSHKH